MNYWYNDAIFYNLYPLGAVNSKRENDYVPSGEGMERLCDWIPHMKKLGCSAVYLGPIFESASHGYDTTDYRKVDSRLGTNGQFTDFVKKCHDAGIMVVVDGVFNHTGRDFFAFRDLREKGSASGYKDWYRGVNFGGNTPRGDGFGYEAWRGHYELPRLNPHHPPVREYLFDTARMWIRDFGVDGIRLDCADCLDFGFMKELRRVCLAERPDFWLMGEIIHGDYTRWVNGDTLHSATNYECQKGLYSSHNDGNMHEIGYSFRRQFGQGGIYKGLMLYNFVDNHDVNRLADTVKKPQYLPTIYTLLYTMPGLPSVYYGSEWGIHGVTDRVTDWALRPTIDIRSARFDDPALMAHITALAKVRTTSDALRHGDYTQLAVTSHQLAFRRSTGSDTAIVAVNCADTPALLNVDADGGSWTDLLTGQSTSSSGGLSISLPAFGGAILTKSAAPQTTQIPAREQPAAEAPRREEPAARPAAPPVAADSGGTLLSHAPDMALEHVGKHPVFEHRRRAFAEGRRCKVAVYELAPGKSAYPMHYHTANEEVFYILSGRGLLRTASGEKTVTAGDLVFFPAGEQGAHRLINNHYEPLRYIDFDALAQGDACVYPDSQKCKFWERSTDSGKKPVIMRANKPIARQTAPAKNAGAV